MSKTITMRVDDDLYRIIKKAADGEKRSVSNFLEWAAFNYITSDIHVGKSEMEEILQNTADLDKGLSDAKEGKYRVVE
ncbi:MAG: CopG family transcriptional regulator [Brevinematales bacterium]|nr:CopG family transcriptional regulator [Brevinematales bacterium]